MTEAENKEPLTKSVARDMVVSVLPLTMGRIGEEASKLIGDQKWEEAYHFLEHVKESLEIMMSTIKVEQEISDLVNNDQQKL